MMKNKLLSEIIRISFVIFIAVLIGFLITLFVSDDAWHAFKILLTGPLPKVSFSEGLQIKGMSRLGLWLIDATTLSLLGLSVCIAFRAKQFSMAAEGQLFLGALAAAIVGLYWVGPPILIISLALLVAMSVGFLWGLIPGYLKAYLGANEIVSTLMLNVIAVQLYRFILVHYLNDPSAGFIASPLLPEYARLPIILSETKLTSMFYIMLAAIVIVCIMIFRSSFGYKINMIGINPKFAQYGGINTKKTIMLTFAVSGIFAALAGAHLSLGVSSRLNLYLAPGIGFEGIVVALLARNNPKLILVSGLLYSYLRVGAQIMERSSDVSREIVLIIQALIILFVTIDQIKPWLIKLKTRLNHKKEKIHV